MRSVKLMCLWSSRSSFFDCKSRLLIINDGFVKCYSEKSDAGQTKSEKSTKEDKEDEKCKGDLGYKHKLVPCKEIDAVEVCIKEPNQIKPVANLPCKCDEYYSVVIIGAGLAGLFAAARMMSCKLTDFVVLEAKNRLGGRVKTAKFNNTLIDLGAEYIEGASIVNPIYQFACLNKLISETSCRGNCDSGVFLLSDARSIEGNEQILNEFNKILDYIPVEVGLDKEYGNCKVFDYVEQKIKEKLDFYPEWERDDLMRMVYSLMNEWRSITGADPALTTLSTISSSLTLPGSRMKFDEGGASLIQALQKQIPKDKIKLNQGVQTVFWAGGDQECVEGRIRVRCCDGSEYKACHVISTVSLGALRCQNTLFSPQLPCEKIKAIHGIPFGKGGKLFLRYQDPFWLDKGLTLRFGWTKEELNDRQDWIKGVGSVEQVPSSTDHILKVTVGGREAQIMEQNKKESAKEFLEWLDATVGFPLSLCVPVEAVVTQWCNDIFTGGSNSFVSPCYQNILAQPLPSLEYPKLLFAGEATEPGYIGSMHSAAKSGIRAADIILKHMKQHYHHDETINEVEPFEQIVETDKPCEQEKKIQRN